MYNIVVLISGSGSNLQAIIDQIDSGEIKAEIAAVISNRADAYGLERAQKAGITTAVLDHTRFDSREAFDLSLAKRIDDYQPDLIVLAGFMRILGDNFVKKYLGKMINIHPSLLPKYKGLHTHKRALQAGDTQHGASVHFVIPELDAGTVIMQGMVPVKPDDSEETLSQRVHQIEHIIYPETIKKLARGDLQLQGDNIYLHGKPLTKPLTVNYQETH
jgi:phosphoribosylglycinamide formyltransferase-1